MKHFSEPEWLGRHDSPSGEWQVEECEARRGIPATSITTRQMLIPTDDTEMARAIRAHEMMHAKVSPAESWEQWQKRGIATKASLVVCEELRVNYLCKKAGFDVDKHLSDGGETADGERVALTNDWAGAVRMAIATAGTSANKKFLTGVRRHNRLWGKALLDISKRAIKEMDKASRSGRLSSTEVHERSGLAPRGFIYTEKLAEWVDRLGAMEPPKEEEEKTGASGAESAETAESDEGEKTEISHSNIGTKGESETEVLNRIKSITPDRMGSDVPYWGELRIEKLPMPIHTKGNLGKVKKASNVGRSPRRMHRYMTDPQRRIFDVKKRGLGGVVVIDASGSMTLRKSDVKAIVEASPGATVIAYSDMGDNGTNTWILADKGRMVDDLPNMGSGNGVDFPAIEWAVKHRQHSSAPVVWVTDGGVCGPNQGFSNTLAVQCVKYCKEKRIITAENTEGAIEVLKRLRSGGAVRRVWPYMLKDAWERLHRESLKDDQMSR